MPNSFSIPAQVLSATLSLTLGGFMLLVTSSIVCYMGLLGALAVASPGVGPIGALMLVLPGDVMEWMHAPAYGLLGWLAIRGFQRRGWPVPYALIVGVFFAIVFGLWTEVAQASAPGRSPSVKDLLVDALGIFVAGSLVLWQRASSLKPGRFVAVPSFRPLRHVIGDSPR